MIVRPCR